VIFFFNQNIRTNKSLNLIVLFLCICISTKNAKSQAKLGVNDYVLVVPFSVEMILSNGEHLICQSERISPAELVVFLRGQVSRTLGHAMGALYNVKVLDIDDKAMVNDLSTLYKIIKVSPEMQPLQSFYKGYPPKPFWKFFQPKSARWGTDCVNSNSTPPHKCFRNFAQVSILNDSAFTQVCKNNDAAFVVVISRFEMNTRYRNCSDLANNVYQRDIIIHYSLLDNSGKFIDGGMVGTTIQESSNKIKDVYGESIAVMSKAIAGLIKKRI